MNVHVFPSFERCQENVGAGVPLAVTVNVAVCPTVTVVSMGWVVIMAPGPFAGFTDKVAEPDCTLPAVLETTTEKVAPVSEIAVVVILYDAPVAPLRLVPFLRH
jgi:hypothetical protein